MQRVSDWYREGENLDCMGYLWNRNLLGEIFDVAHLETINYTETTNRKNGIGLASEEEEAYGGKLGFPTERRPKDYARELIQSVVTFGSMK